MGMHSFRAWKEIRQDSSPSDLERSFDQFLSDEVLDSRMLIGQLLMQKPVIDAEAFGSPVLELITEEMEKSPNKAD